MGFLFSSESVSEGHPDKIADQISDAILDEYLKYDPDSRVACETLVTTGLVILSGEVKSKASIDVQKTVREVIKKIGYTKSEYKFEAESCGILSSIHEQSPDINRGVDKGNEELQGAGDQGMMFGYACNETDNFMPLPIELAHLILKELSAIRKEGKQMTYLRPDAKSQVTIEYEDNLKPRKIHTIVISTQHDEFADDDKMHKIIKEDIKNILLPAVIEKLPERIAALFNNDFILHVNPTGKFVIGGPHGDTGLTGRKIIVDTYGGRGAHGGGAFSGKDSSKVDRSAAYAARHIAKNMVAAGVADEVLIQISYAIGIAQPIAIYVNTFNTSHVNLKDEEISKIISEIFDLRPAFIIKRFGLKNPIYFPTASYGHMGRTPYKQNVEVFYNGIKEAKEVEFFPWENLDYIEPLITAFKL